LLIARVVMAMLHHASAVSGSNTQAWSHGTCIAQ